MSEGQNKRIQKSKRIEVEDYYKQVGREAAYVAKVVNEDGEDKKVSLFPDKVLSETGDMKHRAGDGYVGKYLLALAREDPQFRSELRTGIKNLLDTVEVASKESEALSQVKSGIEQLEDVTDHDLDGKEELMGMLDEFSEGSEFDDPEAVKSRLNTALESLDEM